MRNRISWEREKGRAAENNWKNCLEDIWFFTKSDEYKFNLDAVRVQKTVIAPYRDNKGKPKDWVEEAGVKIRYTAPSNIWTDITIPFWSMEENTEHPTQKSLKVIEEIIKVHTNKDDIILDPFMGSGTTGVAALNTNRKFIGVEVNPKYFDIAVSRIVK